MSATSRPQDKFAFLFTGPTTTRYQKDIQNVYETLTEYYNYPPGNIYIGCGGTTDIGTLFPAVPAANKKYLSNPATAAAEFSAFITLFKASVNANDITLPLIDDLSTALLYFTGIGKQAGPGPMDTAELVIHPGTPDIVVTQSELTGYLNTPAFSRASVNIVMQQDYANDFLSPLISAGFFSTDKTGTWVIGTQTGTTYGNDIDGGFFTNAWCRALKQETTVNDPGPKYPDELVVGTGTELFLITLEQAKRFAELYNGTLYGFQHTGAIALLGRPNFYIEDGDASDGWWESPSIYLTHPLSADPTKKNDLYITDLNSAPGPVFNNTINVEVRNTGTHPVRKYMIQVRVFRTPSGGTTDFMLENGRSGATMKPTNRISYKTFSNSNMDHFTWNTRFPELTTHECIRAKALMATNNPAEPFNDTWSIVANDNEAQRNTDAGSDPLPVGDEKAVDTFRGFKKHYYQIKNPFEQTHQFRLVTTPQFAKAMKYAGMNWYVAGKKGKWESLAFKELEKNFTFASFVLGPGEEANLIGEFGYLKNYDNKEIRLPVEVVVDKIDGVATRRPLAKSLDEKFGALAGFTIILTNEPATLAVLVTDSRRKPVVSASVSVSTINGLAKEQFKTDKRGMVILKEINPDVYRLSASYKNLKSGDSIVQLSGKETLKVHLVLESEGKRRVVRPG